MRKPWLHLAYAAQEVAPRADGIERRRFGRGRRGGQGEERAKSENRSRKAAEMLEHFHDVASVWGDRSVRARYTMLRLEEA